MPPARVQCPRCGMDATETQAFLFQKRVAYCQSCGWNIGQATSKLRAQMMSMWLVVGLGVLLASAAWLRGPYGISGGAMIAVPFILLPLISGVAAKYRLSRLPGAPFHAPNGLVHGANSATAMPAFEVSEGHPSIMRPRIVRLEPRGYLHVAGMAVVSAFLLWLMAIVLRGIAGSSNTAITKYIVAILLYSWALWLCFSFFRNRVRERQLFANGVFSQGRVLNQSDTRYGSRIVYRFRDTGGATFSKSATDFSSKLYDEMPISVFYDPLNPSKCAALESSLYRVG